MATNKTLNPTGVTIAIPAMADKPDASVFSNCIDKEADAINTLNNTVTQSLEPFNLIKNGKVCILRCQGGLQTEYNDGDTIITLPEAFRANGSFDFPVYSTQGERLGMIRISGITVAPVFGKLLAGNTRFAFAYIAL